MSTQDAQEQRPAARRAPDGHGAAADPTRATAGPTGGNAPRGDAPDRARVARAIDCSAAHGDRPRSGGRHR